MTDEANLIVRARRKDPAAWETLTRVHQQPVFRLAYLLLGDADEAEDAAQETFIKAYYALDSFDSSRPLRPWLLGIAANQARNQRRALGRYLAHLKRFARLQPAAASTRDESQTEEIWEVVRRLNRAFQEVIALRYYFEMSEAEMAETLSIAPGTVKSRLHRALSALREELGPESGQVRPKQKDEIV